MSALTLDSGSYPLIARTKASNDHHRSVATARPSHWLSAGAIALTGCGLLAVTAVWLLLYLLAATAGAVGPGRALLLGAVVITGSAAGMALIAAWTVRVQDARQVRHRAEVRAEVRAELDATASAMACAAAKLRVALDELPEQVRDRVAVQGAVLMGGVDEIGQRLGEVLAEVRDLAKRIEAEESAPDGTAVEGDDRYLAGFADGLAGRTLGEGTVVPINGNGHRKGS